MAKRYLLPLVLFSLSGFAFGAETKSMLETFGLAERGSLRATLRPTVDVTLSSPAAGIIEKIRVPEGSKVKANDPIISLDSDQERADVLQAEAAARGAKAEMERAADEFKRVDQLRKDDVYSEKQYLEARAQAAIARSRSEQADAALQSAQSHLKNRNIVTPVDGVFFKINKVVGESVERYEAVARIVDATSLEMVVFCDARYFELFKNRQKVDVKVDKPTGGESTVTGEITLVDFIIDPVSSTFRVKVKIQPSADVGSGYTGILVVPNS
jgi:RND family efflux transporter MFP subunit